MKSRLNTQNFIISDTNSTVSLINSVFMNAYFNNTMMDLSFFRKIIIQNVLLINNFIFCGIKIHDGNASNVIMNSVQIRKTILYDNFLVFNSLDSTFVIDDMEFFSVTFTKSINN